MPPRRHMRVFSKVIHHQVRVYSIGLRTRYPAQEHTENQVIRTLCLYLDRLFKFLDIELTASITYTLFQEDRIQHLDTYPPSHE